MIRYALRCSKGHDFEGWFRSSAAFDEEVSGLACPLCDDRSIAKAIMAPAVLQRSPAPATPPAAPPVTPPATPPAASDAQGSADRPQPGGSTTVAAAPAGGTPVPSRMPPSPEQLQLARMVTALRRLRAHVEANFEHVGDRFAAEARKIHNEETEPRGIYGQASADEIRELEDEGIEIAPLPNVPKMDG